MFIQKGLTFKATIHFSFKSKIFQENEHQILNNNH